MAAFITLAQACTHLRVDFPSSADDNDVIDKMEQACDIVRDYLHLSPDAYITSSGDIDAEIPQRLVTAALLVLGELYKEREAGADPISPGVVRILSRSRTPVLS